MIVFLVVEIQLYLFVVKQYKVEFPQIAVLYLKRTDISIKNHILKDIPYTNSSDHLEYNVMKWNGF